MNQPSTMSEAALEQLIGTLKSRFDKNKNRHPDLAWATIQTRLEVHPEKLWSLQEMERTGGEPDVVGFDSATGEIIFYDCSPDSPAGRRNVCYDQEALEARKKFPPETSALQMAAAMGITVLSEDQYRELQKLGEFDTKTSSWVTTPSEVRKLGGALFCDRRFNRVFTYHNGADSYYGSRGFRGLVRV